MLSRLRRFFFATLRGRLVLAVAAVHAAMMTLFVVDLTTRQRAMLLDRQVDEAQALAQSISTSAAGWIAAADVSGLQEIVETQRRYPELAFAMITDTRGIVLAHTDTYRRGVDVLDLPKEAKQATLAKTPSMVDVAVPAILGDRHVGWVRVGIAQKAAGAKLADMVRSGVIYALGAILIGAVAAWLMGRGITRRLYVVQETIQAIRSGNRLARSRIAGADEAAIMAREFNSMLDALAERDAERVVMTRQLEGVNGLQQSLLKPASLATKLASVTDGIVQHFDADFCRVWTIAMGDLCERGCTHAEAVEGPHVCRFRNKCLHLVASSGRYTHLDGKGHRRVPFGAYKIGRIASGDEHKFLIGDVANEPRVHDRDWARRLGLRSFAGYQLRVPGGETIGVLALFSKRSILPHEDAMLDGLSSAIALAIQQAAAEAALQKVLDDLEARVEQRTNELTQANESMRGEITERRKAEAAQATAQSERDAVELRLRQAQKLEAVGQLAAGIAHEINTPAQFVGDSVQFLSGAFRDLLPLFQKYRQAGLALATVPGMAELAREMSEAAEAADLVYVEASAQESFARALDGISRIASIVRAMKEFAHPDSREKGFADLNQALKTTLTIAHNEYKYVADVETSLADIPLVPCHLGDINQVFLNLLVNAAHAIGDVVGNSGSRGRILVRTVQDGANLRVDIEDSGCGIPLEIRDRIFDPFFTTKPVGKGSGQGLAIARSIIVDRHGGDLTFESVLGKGTTFTIRLPISAPSEGKADGTVG